MEKIAITISENDDQTRIDRILKRIYPFLTQNIIEKSIRKNLITLNSKKTQSNYRARENEILHVAEFLTKNIESRPKKAKLISVPDNAIEEFRRSIIFQNQDIIVLNKNSGLATQQGSKIKYSVDDIIKTISKSENLDLKLVHRLDKDTSGALLIATNIKSANLLTKYFRERNITKKYLALVLGRPKDNENVIDINIAKQKINNIEKMTDHDLGDKAITEYKVIDYISNKISLIEFSPITGRTHQIRIHAKLMNMPIIGDKKYGYYDDNISINQDKLNLHSWKIDLDNFLGEKYNFIAPIPKYMSDNIKELGLKLK